MTVIGEQPLARFVDRQTLVYDRTYPHPIERVWDAVTTAAHVEAWLLPETRIERRLGGAAPSGGVVPPTATARRTGP